MGWGTSAAAAANNRARNDIHRHITDTKGLNYLGDSKRAPGGASSSRLQLGRASKITSHLLCWQRRSQLVCLELSREEIRSQSAWGSHVLPYPSAPASPASKSEARREKLLQTCRQRQGGATAHAPGGGGGGGGGPPWRARPCGKELLAFVCRSSRAMRDSCLHCKCKAGQAAPGLFLLQLFFGCPAWGTVGWLLWVCVCLSWPS